VKIRLSEAQHDMLEAIYGQVWGFFHAEATARSLVKRGFLETRGMMLFRLTPDGIKVCEEIFGSRGGA